MKYHKMAVSSLKMRYEAMTQTVDLSLDLQVMMLLLSCFGQTQIQDAELPGGSTRKLPTTWAIE